LDEAALARFRNEVRIARQVSHPNVCRVSVFATIYPQHTSDGSSAPRDQGAS
jgi:hypothetical protein